MLVRANSSLQETQTETEVACAVETKYTWTKLIQVHVQKHVLAIDYLMLKIFK
jgi:hypothetical protein